MNSPIVLIIFILVVLIWAIYDFRKSKSIKKALKKSDLFSNLQKMGYKISKPIRKNGYPWLTKKDNNGEFVYHCNFRTTNGKLNLELILELKKRVLNENSGFIHDFKLSRKYKDKRLSLNTLSFQKDYKIKKISELPTANKITNDFNEMIKILKLEKIETLSKNSNL